MIGNAGQNDTADAGMRWPASPSRSVAANPGRASAGASFISRIGMLAMSPGRVMPAGDRNGSASLAICAIGAETRSIASRAAP